MLLAGRPHLLQHGTRLPAPAATRAHVLHVLHVPHVLHHQHVMQGQQAPAGSRPSHHSLAHHALAHHALAHARAHHALPFCAPIGHLARRGLWSRPGPSSGPSLGPSLGSLPALAFVPRLRALVAPMALCPHFLQLLQAVADRIELLPHALDDFPSLVGARFAAALALRAGRRGGAIQNGQQAGKDADHGSLECKTRTWRSSWVGRRPRDTASRTGALARDNGYVGPGACRGVATRLQHHRLPSAGRSVESMPRRLADLLVAVHRRGRAGARPANALAPSPASP